MISRVGIIAGLGDALNARAFLITYCQQKEISQERISIYTELYWDLFKNTRFKRGFARVSFRGLIGYKNFGNYDMPKVFEHDKCDLCIAKNAGIDFSFDTRVPLNWNTPFPYPLPEKFVTIHNGFGRLSGSAGNPNKICTKAWDNTYWQELVKKIGIPCVQIGYGASCKPIQGVAYDYSNKLNLFQIAEVMKRALFHIDIEGGYVILNQHLGGRSVVLFGPTAIENQGRSFNLNLRSNTCIPCYEWGTHKYKLNMDRNRLPCNAHCMTDIKPEFVIEQIYKNKWL